MLVDQLDLIVAAEQQAEVVEGADHALQLDPVDQEGRHRHLVLADVVQEHVLKLLPCLCRHPAIPSRSAATPRPLAPQRGLELVGPIRTSGTSCRWTPRTK